MALRNPLMVKNVVGDTQLTLTAKAGESLLVTGIRIAAAASSHCSITVARASVGYWRVGGTQGNHLFFPSHVEHRVNLFEWLILMGLMDGYPIPEGETLSLAGVKQATSFAQVRYQVYDAGDQKLNSPNGPEADQYVFVNYGRPTTSVAEGADAYDDQVNPVEFFAFPYEGESPAGKLVELLGIAISNVGKDSATGTNKQITNFLKLTKERRIIGDDDRDGFLLYGVEPAVDTTGVATGYDNFGNLADTDLRAPLMFDEPLRFQPNEELNVELFTSLGAGAINLAVADVEIGMILRVSNLR